jgi:hypothetical protein
VRPCTLKNVRQGQHRHVASHAVATARHVAERLDRSRPRLRGAEIELRRIRPGREIGVFAESDFAPGVPDEDLGPGLDPIVIPRHVVRHEIEDEADPARFELSPEHGERFVAAEGGVDGITRHGEWRSDDVRVGKTGQRHLVFGA